MTSSPPTPRIEDYALIGDLQTAALVHSSGSIDWCCFPRFDSGACFAALLGDESNGHWQISPVDPVRSVRRRYLPGALVLETEIETDGGVIRLVDFMPPRGKSPDIIRIVEGVRGNVPVRSELIIRFDYGHILPWVFHHEGNGATLAIAGPDAICLRTPVETHGENMTTVSEFTVASGERHPFVLTWFQSHLDVPDPVDPELALAETISYWDEWDCRCDHFGEYDEVIHESLRVLKALTYGPTGGIVAAPTTSLPEWLGGERNWDYRFCWLRDSTLTLMAMLNAGYREEALAWREWLIRAVAGDPAEVQIVYGISGERRIEEYEAHWLAGFGGSFPVRIGNAASHQVQLDVYGEVMDAAYHSLVAGIDGSPISWALLTHMLEHLEEHWFDEDAGIWEVRGPSRHFTHSKVMAWVAFDRGVRICEEFGRDGPVDRWKVCREQIAADIHKRAWCERKQAYSQYYEGDHLDASVLMMPMVGFMDANDPRFVSTVAAIERELMVDGLVLRYRTDNSDVDGLPGHEGVFLACSFWLVEVLAMQNRLPEAKALFDYLLTLRNDVGLLAEEYDPRAGQQLGNFPQAFTHLALVDAALVLSTFLDAKDS